MAEVARRHAQALVPILVFTAVLLLALLAFNLRNLDPGAEELPPPVGGGESTGGPAAAGAGDVLRWMYVASLVSLVAIALVGAFLLWRRGIKPWQLLSVWELLGLLLALVLVGSLLLFWPEVHAGLTNFARWATGGADPGAGDPGTGNPTPLPVSTNPTSFFLIVTGLGVASYALAMAVLFLRRMFGVASVGPPTAERRRRALAQTVRRAIADLEAGEDFRAAVFRCYRSMVLLFEAHGLRQQPTQTAREFESEALHSAGVSREGIDDLTSLFEEARYSTHAIREPQRDAAIACLQTIRAQLEGAA